MAVPVGGIDREELDRLIKQTVENDTDFYKPGIIRTNFDFNSDGSIITSNTSYYPSSSLMLARRSGKSEYSRYVKFSRDILQQVQEAREHAEAAAKKAAEADDPGMQWPPGKIFM